MSGPPPVPFVDLIGLHDTIAHDLDHIWSSVTGSAAFIGGSYAERFEREYAEYCEASHCVGVANGTDALELILQALDIGAGDDVIVPSNTFVATAEAVQRVGARPAFADVDPDTLLLTADTAKAAVTDATVAIIAVHLFGQPADMDALGALASGLKVPLIEDAAQAHGARWHGRRVGSLGTAAAFSFYPSKNLGAFGDAGAVVTDDEDLADAIRCLADHGRSTADRSRHIRVGRNSRLDGLQAAVLSAKLRSLHGWNEQRRAIHHWYTEFLAGSGAATLSCSPHAEHVHHLEVVRVARRADVIAACANAGVGSGIHYPVPCHHLDPFLDVTAHALPVVERAAAEIVSLPMHPLLTEEQVRRTCRVVASVVG